MAVRALFRLADYAVTNDNASSIGASTSLLTDSIGMATPNATFNQSSGTQRIDTVADEIASPTVAAAGTYSVDLTSLTATLRTLFRVTAPGPFSVTITPHSTAAFTLHLNGSAYQPAILEMHLADLDSVTITNNATTSLAFQITSANIVDYNDPSVATGVPSGGGAAGGTNATLAPGYLPLGAIIPVAGTFTLANNGGVYDEGLVTPIANWLKICDGTVVNDAASIMFGRFVPNLGDDRFIMGAGNTAAGVVGGVSTIDFTHTHTGTTNSANVNTTTRTINVAVAAHTITQPTFTMDNHSHGVSVAFASGEITQPTFTVDGHQHSITHVHMWCFAQASNDDHFVLTASDTTKTTITNADSLIAYASTNSATAGSTGVLWTSGAGNPHFYTTGVLSPPNGTSGSGALSGVANVNTTTITSSVAIPNKNITSGVNSVDTTTRTTDVALSAHSITQPTFTVDAHTHTFTSAASLAVTDIRPKWIAFKYMMRIK